MTDDLRPDPSTVARLRALSARYGLRPASALGPISPAEQHRREKGHKLAFGCCKGSRPDVVRPSV